MRNRPSRLLRLALADIAAAEDECVEWRGSKDRRGYGMYHIGGRHGGAHRLVYEAVIGPIPIDLEIDHLCKNPACVNPAHLEPVTHLENIRRGAIAQKTHCKNGHPFDEENTRVHLPPQRRARQCRACDRDRKRAARQRKEAA